MSEKEILDKIKESAAQEKIPESIEPEQIKRKLKENQSETKKWNHLLWGCRGSGTCACHRCSRRNPCSYYGRYRACDVIE
jgi:hypothetical protein